jgi:hypothetical protein
MPIEAKTEGDQISGKGARLSKSTDGGACMVAIWLPITYKKGQKPPFLCTESDGNALFYQQVTSYCQSCKASHQYQRNERVRPSRVQRFAFKGNGCVRSIEKVWAELL